MESLEQKELLFGTKAVEERESASLLRTAVTKMAKLQSLKFWILTYIVSLLMYQLHQSINFTLTVPAVVHVIDAILFPFTVLLIVRVANLSSFFSPWLYEILYPSYKVKKGSSNLIKLIILLVKAIFYIILWKFTFIFGIFGLIMTVSDVKNLSK